MKKIILINTHLYSGSEVLYSSMSDHPLIQSCRKLGGLRLYQSNLDLVRLSEVRHKSNKKKSFYLDEVAYNQSLSTKLDYSKCFVINFLRRPKETLESLVFFNKLNPLFALRYYQYRLNRIYQISKIAKNSIFLKFESLDEKILSDLSSKLGLDRILLKKEMFELFNRDFRKEMLTREILAEAEGSYEKYHYLLTKTHN